MPADRTAAVSELHDRAEAIIEAALTQLAEIMAVEADGTCVATNWVMVVEWSTVDGKQWLSRWLSRWWDEKRPVWQRDGLLHAALDWSTTDDDDG